MNGIIIVFSVLVIGFILAAAFMKSFEIERENQMMQSYMLSMREFYFGIQDRIEATRRYRHDLAGHIQTLEMLLKQHFGTEEMQVYMDDLKSRYYKLKSGEFCENDFVNAILTIKQEQCAEKGIPFSAQIEKNSYGGIEEVDLAGLLHNLMDNAIEAQDRIPGGQTRGIWLLMREMETEIEIEIRNCIKQGEKVNFTTKKKNSWQHGIGMQVIANLTEKYQGTTEFFVSKPVWQFSGKIRLRKKEVFAGETGLDRRH